MPRTMDPDAAWNGINAMYADPAVQRDLLRRQDSEGLDVTLHLFSLWADTQGVRLDAAALAEADAFVARWRTEVIAPLRALRRKMKAMDGVAPDRRTIDAVRAQVQAAELAAERAQVDMLCDWLRTR